jgi:hypothetical protein
MAGPSSDFMKMFFSAACLYKIICDENYFQNKIEKQSSKPGFKFSQRNFAVVREGIELNIGVINTARHVIQFQNKMKPLLLLNFHSRRFLCVLEETTFN